MDKFVPEDAASLSGRSFNRGALLSILGISADLPVIEGVI